MGTTRALRSVLKHGLLFVQLGSCLWAEDALAQDPSEVPLCAEPDDTDSASCETNPAKDGQGSDADPEVHGLDSFEAADLDAEGLWLDSWHWDWDPQWGIPWLPQAPGWTLSIAAGRRTFESRSVLGVEVPYASGHEWFGTLTLRLPFDALTATRALGRKPGFARWGADPQLGLASDARKRKAEPRGWQVKSGVFFPLVSEDPAPSGQAAPKETPLQSPSDASSSIRSVVPHSDKSANAQSEKSYLALLQKTVEMTELGFERGGGARRFSSMVRRSRSSGLVPELRLRGVLGFDRTTSSEDVLGAYPGETSTRGGRDSLLEARLTFHLDRLVLGAQEPAVERQRVQWQKQRSEQVQAALDAVAEWLTLAIKMRQGDMHLEERLDLIEQQYRVLARAHGLTWGWFEGEQTLSRLGLKLGPLDPPQQDLYRRRTEAP